MAAEKSRDTVNPNTIRNILTLRYDSSQKPILPKLSWNNFSTNQAQPNLDTVENLIENYLRNKIGIKTDKIAIALSGGVDSTLVIAFLRHVFPQIKIEAISIRFANSVDETISAAKIAEHFGANHHIVELSNYLEELPKAISMIASWLDSGNLRNRVYKMAEESEIMMTALEDIERMSREENIKKYARKAIDTVKGLE